MIVNFTYQPCESISINGILLSWGASRQETRTLLSGDFETSDYDVLPGMTQRRDIYKNYLGSESYFFLNFDAHEQLMEAELHDGCNIEIKGIHIDFEMEINKAAELLDSISNEKQQLSEGEYFYEDLKLVIMSSEAMGSEGYKLSYFYCAKEVGHLLNS